MVEKVAFAGVRRALDQARAQRTEISRGAPLPIDTAHVVGACPNCGHLGSTVIGFPDPPYAGPQGRPRYRNAPELLRFIQELFDHPPAMPAQDDPATAIPNSQQAQWKGFCVCGAKVNPPMPDPRTGQMVSDPEATPRRVCGARFFKAMPGAGAEFALEALSGGGAVPYTQGAEITYQMLRVPLDGIESVVAESVEDPMIQEFFGRPLTLAETWRVMLDKAAAGEEVLQAVEAGYWIWAGPRENTALDEKIAVVKNAGEEREVASLLGLAKMGVLPVGPAFPMWAYEHTEKLLTEKLRAGVVIDHALVRKLLEGALERASLHWEEKSQGKLLLAHVGEVRCPVEPPVVALGAGHLAWFFGETVGAAVGEAVGRISEIQRFLHAARAERPDITFDVDGMRAVPRRADGSMGRAINLMDTPFKVAPGSRDFKRELKFNCDDLPKGSNPTKMCPCGEKAWVAARIFPERVIEDFSKATGGKTPRVIDSWPDASLIATISCDRHVRIPMADEINESGLEGELLNQRMAQDLPSSVFAVDVSVHEDKPGGKRALLAFGPLVASVVVNDHLVSGLYQACRLPDGALPLRTTEVCAVITTQNVICLHEPDFDDDRLEQVLDQGAAMDGLPENVPTPFYLSWDVLLNATPVGRFMPLRPPPQGAAPPPSAPARVPNGARR